MPPQLKHYLAGRTFGWLLVLRKVAPIRSRTLWMCRCLCGASMLASSGDLLRASVKSCGCRRRTLHRAQNNEGASMALAIRYGDAINEGVDYDANEADREQIRAAHGPRRKNRAGEKRKDRQGKTQHPGADGA